MVMPAQRKIATKRPDDHVGLVDVALAVTAWEP
jgi:hypothetical protein